MRAEEKWAEIKNFECPDCSRLMLHIGLLPRMPFRPMQDIFHCDACQHTKLREVPRSAAVS
jgi:rubredoxin